MNTVKIIGVAEHFNFPWRLAIEEGAFQKKGIDLQWTDIPEGTGRMCQMLQDRKTDLSIILTEGIVKSITEGNPSKIVQEYIASPLIWGIYVGEKGSYLSIDDIEKGKIAISRFGSGSHLMAYINAQNNDWDTDKLQFKIVNNLDGAITALTNGQADYFMWESFTTKPFVDNGVFRRLGDCPTPWPCFVIAATSIFVSENIELLKHILEVINIYTAEFKSIPSINRNLANAYNQKLEDINEWLKITSWSQSQLDSSILNKIQNTLLNLKLILKILPSPTILK